MKKVLVICECLTLVLGVKGLGFWAPRQQQDDLVNRANIYYMNPGPSSKSFSALRLSDVNTLRNKDSVKLILHGYIASMDHSATLPLRNAYLLKGSDSVLMVDWRDASSLFYPTSRYLIERVGIRFAKILENFMRKQNIMPSSIHLLGHSLGAHMAGVIGRYFNGTLGRVTGLDPAKPLFQGNCRDCLNFDVAQFVDVIHTDYPVFGDITPRGHADFYPNNGFTLQPGCEFLDFKTATSCSHYRAPLLYAESIRFPNNFPSVICSIEKIRRSNGRICLRQDNNGGNKEIILMGENVSRRARGQYYLDTNYMPPYGVKGGSIMSLVQNNG